MMSKALLLALVVSTVNAQPDSTLVDTTASVDTVLYRPGTSLTLYSPVTNPENYEKHLYQNPTVALFKSMLVPGFGQLGNRRRFKAVLFFGLDVWFVGSAIHYGRQADDFWSEYESWDPATEVGRKERNKLYPLYEDRRDERNKFTWYAVIVTFVSMFDAYVDAHLSGFPQAAKNDAVSFDLQPSREGGLAAYVSISF
jgi:hypothetical protein